MERKNYTVAVDLGSSNVVVAVGEKNAEERLDVVCVVSIPTGTTARKSSSSRATATAFAATSSATSRATTRAVRRLKSC